MTLHQWLVFLPAALLIAVSPGANNFLAMANGMRSGMVPAVLGLAGRLLAFTLMMIVVLIGFGAVLAASATAFTVIKWAGVAYLAWLGIRLWRSPTLTGTGGPARSVAGARRLVSREFWVCMTNPKAVLLFTAFLPQFVDPAQPLARQLVPLGAAYIAIELMAACGYAFAGSRIGALDLSERGARRINRLTGGMMLAAAGWLAATKRTA